MNNQKIIDFVRDIYATNEFIPLHAPTFAGNEKAYVSETIDSTFVSSVGGFVDKFENLIESYTKSPRAVATVNGTAALHAALYMAGVRAGDLVITQALTFVATCNVLHHMGAEPVFVDVSMNTLGLCPNALEEYLSKNAEISEGKCVHKKSKRCISAIVPMHTFGHPVELTEISLICTKWNIPLVEDAAESLGSFYNDCHTGTLSQFSALSFNGNKVITTGGGGMILSNSKEGGDNAKHITTTAKVPHPYEFFHDEAGFNYRMPNLNAALGCAQMESLENFISQKRKLAEAYQTFFCGSDFQFVVEPKNCKSNYWLNAVICGNKEERESLIKATNKAGVMSRPIWQLMHRLPAFAHCERDELVNSVFIEERLVNIPSSPVEIQ